MKKEKERQVNKINCPECDHTFEIDDNSYAKILQQVQTNEFNKLVDERVEKEKSINHEKLKVIEAKHKVELDEVVRQRDEKHKTEHTKTKHQIPLQDTLYLTKQESNQKNYFPVQALLHLEPQK